VIERRATDRSRQRRLAALPLWCAECGRPSPPDAAGWRACRIEEVELGEPPELAFFCPVCAELEFGES
jgi:hypothetical protein